MRTVASVAVALVAATACTAAPEPDASVAGTEAPTTTAAVVATQPPGTTEPPPPDDLVDAACAGTLEVATVGRIAAEAGSELSGIVASRANPGVYWVHDDSGSGPELYAVAEDGTLLATLAAVVDPVDWEDIAIAADPDGTGWSLVVGDIGDNGEARTAVQLVRVAEPAVDASGSTAAGTTTATDTSILTLTYPDRPHNAEALLVDPDTGQVVIITKEVVGPAQVFVADRASMVDGATVALTAAGSVDFGDGGLASWVTGADVAPDGSVVVVRTYGGVHLFARTAGQSIADALATAPCAGPPPVEVQGEAVAIDADGRSYLTVSEGEEPLLHRTRPAG